MLKMRASILLSGAAAAALIAALAACSDENHPAAQNSAPAAKVASAASPTVSGNVIATANTAPVIDAPIPANAVGADASATAPVDVADLPPAAQAINQAGLPPPHGHAALRYDPTLLRLEVLLDRAGFSPGAIDGRQGTNLQRAIAGYAQAHGLASTGTLDSALWGQITGADAGPVVQAYGSRRTTKPGPSSERRRRTTRRSPSCRRSPTRPPSRNWPNAST